MLLGAVQGVGFRPFVYRLANEMSLAGWVSNSAQGVQIEVEGPRPALECFRERLQQERPPLSFLQSCEATWLDPAGYEGFVIRNSDPGGHRIALVLPDIATCPDCLREMNDPGNRRYRYPFTNCTHCGPRFSLIDSLPYDRANTSMRRFRLCPECQAEYDDPGNRRFHAQPNACPVCGPQLELWPGNACATRERAPRSLAHGNDALLAAAHVLRCGQILAVKGIGGFHLLVDARNATAVERLRRSKHREEKPFALLFPNLESVKEHCEVSPLEERLLGSPAAPIVLLRRIADRQSTLADGCAPGNPQLGAMLPSNPLHHLLLGELGFPVVATSGNLGDEPICTHEYEALERLRGIADVFLVHNRPIVRHVDDSIVRVMLDREMVLRRARGYAPLPVQTPQAARGGQSLLAVGAHLKNSIALAVGNQVFLSQHIGDLESEPASRAFHSVIDDFQRLYDTTPECIAADLHPDYLSTRYATELASCSSTLPPALNQATARPDCRPVIPVQHHVAHVLSCVAENEVDLPALGVAWDGTGLGTDGTIWGGEFFRVTQRDAERVAHLLPFRLPGGDAAAREPRRAALGLLHQLALDAGEASAPLPPPLADVFSPRELSTLQHILERGVNAPLCSSIGRLFDAVAALVGLRQHLRFEGQAAMELEFAAHGTRIEEGYPFPVYLPDGDSRNLQPASLLLDWRPAVRAILEDVQVNRPAAEISAKLHNALAEVIVSVAVKVGESRVVLSGGCFQNRYLTERTVKRLRAEGFRPYWHQRVPPNDGGIALGQIIAAQRTLNEMAAAVSPPPAEQPNPEPAHAVCHSC